jgi:CheY-like chemotaxis protein
VPLDPPGESREDPLIFVSDASAEAGRLTSALRERGFVVIDVPLALLVGRVAVQKPALILCDVDAPGALEQVRRLRDVPGGGSIDILFFGAQPAEAGALAEELSHEASGYFVRPVDTFQLLRKVEALVGAPSSPGRRAMPAPSSRPPPALPRAPSSPEVAAEVATPPEGRAAGGLPSTTPPKARAPSSLPAGSTSSLPPSRSSAPPARLSSLPAEPSLPAPIPLGFGAEPTARGSPLARQIPQSEISPELENILARAEQRVGSLEGSTRAPASLRLTPEAEVDAVLPADVLAALDEPLDIEDDEEGEPGTGDGSTGGSGSARTGFGTHVGATGAGLSGAGATSAGNVGTGVRAGADVERVPPAAQLVERPSTERPGAAGPTAPPPRRANDSSDRVTGEEPAQSSEPAPTRPPSWPALATSSAMTSVEQRPMSMGPTELERAAQQRAPTPLPPAATPDGNRVGPATARVVEPAPMPPRAPPPDRGASTPEIPAVLGRGDAPLALARAIRSRFSGALAFESEQGIRRVVLRDGDFVTVASSVGSESLLAFLAERGTIGAEVVKSLGHRLPPFGRHAGAALIAHGHLRQDELWPVLRSHAEWLVGHVVAMTGGGASIEREVPARLQAEPAVFGGATGAEVFVEVVRRVIPADQALSRLGGPRARVIDGAHPILLGECALTDAEVALVNRAKSNPLGDLLGSAATTDFAAVLYALVLLGVLEAVGPSAAPSIPAPSEPRIYDLLDEQALRARIMARKALVDEGDYFALLGVSRNATSYDIQRAYNELRREFEPSRALTAGTADLRSEVDLILEVLDEAFEILGDQLRRERYRRALEANP